MATSGLELELVADPAVDRLIARYEGIASLGPLVDLEESLFDPLRYCGVGGLIVDLGGAALSSVLDSVQRAWNAYLFQETLELLPGLPFPAPLQDICFVGVVADCAVWIDVVSTIKPIVVEDEREALLEMGFAFRSLPFDSPWRAGEPEADLRVLIDRLREAGDERASLLAGLHAELEPLARHDAAPGPTLRVVLGNADALRFGLPDRLPRWS